MTRQRQAAAHGLTARSCRVCPATELCALRCPPYSSSDAHCITSACIRYCTMSIWLMTGPYRRCRRSKRVLPRPCSSTMADHQVQPVTLALHDPRAGHSARAPCRKLHAKNCQHTLRRASSEITVGGSCRWSPARMARGALRRAIQVAASRACNNVSHVSGQSASPANVLTAGIVHSGSTLMSSPSVACCAVLCRARVAGMQRSVAAAALSCKAYETYHVVAFRFCGTSQVCLMSTYLASSTRVCRPCLQVAACTARSCATQYAL